ncbi:MAG: hypothetical protein NW226_17235 [Microscillaceae bacterium]|nr:hypothetical protein [Microscillaceae bacterium]
MHNNFSFLAASRGGITPLTIIVIIILMALSSFVTYLIVTNNETNKREEIVASKDEEIKDISEKMENISAKLEEKIKEAKKLGADYKALETYRDQLEADLASLQKTADISQVQVQQYLAKIQAYEGVIAAKDKELAELRAQNEQLSEENESLSTERDSLESSTEALSTTVKAVEESNQKLSSLASVLRAENIQITALSKKNKEESRNVFRAKRIDKLTFDFVIAKNAIAQSGNKDLYLRLVEPAGTVVFNAKAGSGQFDMDGSQASYTTRKQILYNNSQQNVQMAYDRPSDYEFKTGTYTVEIYSDGKQIGYKAFKVE